MAARARSICGFNACFSKDPESPGRDGAQPHRFEMKIAVGHEPFGAAGYGDKAFDVFVSQDSGGFQGDRRGVHIDCYCDGELLGHGKESLYEYRRGRLQDLEPTVTEVTHSFG